MSLYKPDFLTRKPIEGDLTTAQVERGIMLGTMILAMSGQFDDHDRSRGSVINLRTNINKINRRTVKGKKKLAKKLAAMTIKAWEVSTIEDPTVRKYSTALLMSVVWHKYKWLMVKLYGEGVERSLDTITNKIHKIDCPDHQAVEVSTYAVADNIVKSVNKVICDWR